MPPRMEPIAPAEAAMNDGTVRKSQSQNQSIARSVVVLTKENVMFFDVYEDSYQCFRIAQNVTKEWLDEYCKQHGIKVTREHRRGVRYFDAFVK